MAWKTFFSEVEFLAEYPMVNVAISDGTTSVPGYLYGEINAITYVDNGKNCKMLIRFLVSKLQASSPVVSIKVLKLLLYLIRNGYKNIIDEVRFHEVPLKQALTFHGVEDELHGSTFYVEIREMAKELLDIAFSENQENIGSVTEAAPNALTGYGSNANSTKMPGFGFSIKNQKSVSEKVAEGFTNFVEKIIPAVEKDEKLKQVSHLSDSLPQYKPLKIDKSDEDCSLLAMEEPTLLRPPYLDCLPKAERKSKVHRPGRPGGGWDDSDSDDDASDFDAKSSVLEIVPQENSMIVESLEISKINLHDSDWSDEHKLVQEFVINEPLCKLEHSSILSFCKGCSTLNCDEVISFLINKLSEKEENVQLRALVFIEYLLFYDIVILESLTNLVVPSLKVLLETETQVIKSVQIKAKKICLTLENLNKKYLEQHPKN